MTPTKRATVRRRLGTPRATYGPPRGRGKLRHAPILAPLGGALAVVGVGAAVALLLARRERSLPDSDRDELDRDENTNPAHAGEPVPSTAEPSLGELQRLALTQLDLAIELLSDLGVPAKRTVHEGLVPDERTAADKRTVHDERTVHETRKALKRLRALMRLLRPHLGRKRFARENRALRDAGRHLAGVRDAEVLVSTLDELVHRHPKRLSRSAAVARLRALLVAERESTATRALGEQHARELVLRTLGELRTRVLAWSVDEPASIVVQLGLAQLYKEGQQRKRIAQRRGSTQSLHDWRKRVKDLRYAAELLDRKRGSNKRLRQVARRAERLGELLGQEHDLALLGTRVQLEQACFDGERATGKDLQHLIARSRRRLRRKARRRGQRLYQLSPRKFARSAYPF